MLRIVLVQSDSILLLCSVRLLLNRSMLVVQE
jgi:hypothetical protein